MEQAISTKPAKITMSEYFAAEELAEFKSDYRSGRVVAMSGGSIEHAAVGTNLAGEIRQRLKGKPCRAYSNDLKIGIPKRPFTHYPDLSVFCGPVQRDDRDAGGRTATNPTLIVEVLSTSTETYDRSDKFDHYRLIESFKEYVLVSQVKPRVETFFRKDDGTWMFAVAGGLDATVKLTSIGIEVPLSEIYAGVAVEIEDETSEPSSAAEKTGSN